MNAVREAIAVVDISSMDFVRMQSEDVPAILAIEKDAYPYPWTRGNFLDSIDSGYETWMLCESSGILIGYFLLLLAVDEAHLLNITVRPNRQGRGVGRILLDKVTALAREKGMASVLLEVRPSNVRALEIYEHYGFSCIGRRKEYYPASDGREDAIVMRLPL